jgi:hypothetical protein
MSSNWKPSRRLLSGRIFWPLDARWFLAAACPQSAAPKTMTHEELRLLNLNLFCLLVDGYHAAMTLLGGGVITPNPVRSLSVSGGVFDSERGVSVASAGRGGDRGGRTMMRSPQQPSLHMAIGGADRRQALGRWCTCLSQMRPVVRVPGVGLPGNNCGRQRRRCERQAGYKYNFVHRWPHLQMSHPDVTTPTHGPGSPFVEDGSGD